MRPKKASGNVKVKPWRAMLTASALAMVSLVGQFLAARDLKASGHATSIALVLEMAGIFFVPTSVIISGAIVWSFRRTWRQHLLFYLLASLNLAIGFSFAWFIFANR